MSPLKNLFKLILSPSGFACNSTSPPYIFTLPVYPDISSFNTIFPFAVIVSVELLIFNILVLSCDFILSLNIICAFSSANKFIVPALS